MRRLLKRDDPKLKARVSSKHQLLLGSSCLTAHASGASPLLEALPLHMQSMVLPLGFSQKYWSEPRENTTEKDTEQAQQTN